MRTKGCLWDGLTLGPQVQGLQAAAEDRERQRPRDLGALEGGDALPLSGKVPGQEQDQSAGDQGQQHVGVLMTSRRLGLCFSFTFGGVVAAACVAQLAGTSADSRPLDQPSAVSASETIYCGPIPYRTDSLLRGRPARREPVSEAGVETKPSFGCLGVAALGVHGVHRIGERLVLAVLSLES